MNANTSSTPATQATQTEVQSEYFNLQTNGLGYLNRVRSVGKGKNAYLACTIAALRGAANDVEYTKFDVNVRASALKAVELLEPHVNTQGVKVLIAFRISDFYPEVFTQTVGDNAGKPATVIKGRLLKIMSAKVNGQVIELPSDTSSDAGALPTAPASNESSDSRYLSTGTEG
jgi:Protein of unknown function (DUF3577)